MKSKKEEKIHKAPAKTAFRYQASDQEHVITLNGVYTQVRNWNFLRDMEAAVCVLPAIASSTDVAASLFFLVHKNPFRLSRASSFGMNYCTVRCYSAKTPEGPHTGKKKEIFPFGQRFMRNMIGCRSWCAWPILAGSIYISAGL